MSGPLLDRIDLHVQVPAMKWKAIAELPAGVDTTTVRARVLAARARQHERRATTGADTNAAILDGRLDDTVRPSAPAQKLLATAVDEWGLSARALRRALRIARTIADLEGSTDVDAGHVAEALSYRSWDPIAAARVNER